MALIVCKKCGKRVSDTAEKCIHCGASLTDNDDAVKQEKETISKNIDEQSDLKIPEYSSYDDDDKIRLENEFLKSDRWAKKFRRMGIELGKFKSLFLEVMFAFVAYVGICRYCYNNVFNKTIYNEKIMAYSIVIISFLFVICFALLIATSIMGIVHKRSVKKYIYMKKYQRWLLKEKGISYTPLFVELKEKAIFDNVNLDKINF